MNNIKKLLGKRIKELRLKRKLTQEKLAELINIGTPNISYIENGKFAPSCDTLVKLSKALNVAPYELYMFETLKSTDEIKKEMLEAFDNNDELLILMYKIFRSIKT